MSTRTETEPEREDVDERDSEPVDDLASEGVESPGHRGEAGASVSPQQSGPATEETAAGVADGVYPSVEAGGSASDDPDAADRAEDDSDRAGVDPDLAARPDSGPEGGPTGRYRVALPVTMAAAAAGLILTNTAIFLSAVVALAYAAYGSVTRPPRLDVAVSRTISDRSPSPGDTVEVTVAVENEGVRPIADCRIVDRVPEGLRVIDGSPRHCTSLRPDESTSFSYTLRARRGDHAFDGTVVVGRNVSGSEERRVVVDHGSTLGCRAHVDHLPLTEQTIPYTGRVPTDAGGEGVEFYATREYHPTDPMNRIDWTRFARTRELSTVEFRETRAAHVVVVVDATSESAVARRPGDPHAVDLSKEAALELVDALLDRNNHVGLALVGTDGGYLAPGTGDAQRTRTEKLLSEGGDVLARQGHGRSFPLRGWSQFRALRRQLPDDAQVVLLSPMLTRNPRVAAKRLGAYGHSVTVVSPDVTDTETPGGTVAGLRRGERLDRLRRDRVRVVDWSVDEPLVAAIERANARWSE